MLAVLLHVDVEELTAAFRILAIVAPIVVGLVAYRLAIETARVRAPVGSGRWSVIRRTSEGGFEEIDR